jgi:hypothetical protein
MAFAVFALSPPCSLPYLLVRRNKMNLLDQLRNRFLFLTFLTDQEIDNLMSIVRSVAVGSSVTADEILQYIDQESSDQLAFC